MKKSEIYFSIALDDQKVPEAISWRATDAGEKIHFAKAINISLWDRDEAGTMKIDLWTKDMPVDEMKYFCIDSIGAMAQSIMTATNDQVMAKKMRDLCEDLMKHVEQENKNNNG
ncbi:gliding motility protein GldC [Pontibacter sp. 13R65]|uniref:gliding motility protein GldC n=1 Tax=Pontibacter sp. 13R65 TaxID=3127458 RepID=UPI00301BDC0C